MDRTEQGGGAEHTSSHSPITVPQNSSLLQKRKVSSLFSRCRLQDHWVQAQQFNQGAILLPHSRKVASTLEKYSPELLTTIHHGGVTSCPPH